MRVRLGRQRRLHARPVVFAVGRPRVAPAQYVVEDGQLPAAVRQALLRFLIAHGLLQQAFELAGGDAAGDVRIQIVDVGVAWRVGVAGQAEARKCEWAEQGAHGTSDTEGGCSLLGNACAPGATRPRHNESMKRQQQVRRPVA